MTLRAPQNCKHSPRKDRVVHEPARTDRSAGPSITLIVCTLGRLDPLDRLLSSLRRQTRSPLEILLVDQNPVGFLQPVLERHRDLALTHLVDCTEEPGLSRGRNLGLKVARGDIVGFPDDDCWYDPDVLSRVAARFTQDGELALLTGRTVDAEGAESVSAHLPASAPITRTNVFFAGNSNGLFVRRAAAARVGGFDESLGVGARTPFQSGEETDFVLRCLRASHACRFESDLVIRHARSDETPRARSARAGRYAPGFGRVLRLHGYPRRFAAERVLRAVARGTALLLAGHVEDARGRYAWARGAARGYLAPGAMQGARPVGRARPFGLSFSPLDESELADQVLRAPVPRGVGPRVVATANLDHIVRISRNSPFRRAYGRAWAVTADGMPVYLYSRWRGAPVPARVTGSDLFARLMPRLSPERHRCYFVAASMEIGERLVGYLVDRGFPEDSLAYCVPPQGFEAHPGISRTLADAVRTHGTTHLFVGVGAPKSEIWTDGYRERLGDCYVFNIGAALAFFAGTARRAPRVLQRAGLEWAWRVACEPTRLSRRYFVDSWRFLEVVADDVRHGSQRQAGEPLSRAGGRGDA